MNLWEAVDLYCERSGVGLWAEPANALSNLAFFAAAWIGWRALRRSGRVDPVVATLVILVAVIGLGSFLFHTFANVWSVIADIAPITIFIYAYLALALRRFLAFAWPATAALLLLFVALSWALETTLRPLLAASAGYVPAFIAMLATGSLLFARHHAAGPWLLTAALVFLVSLTLRTLDEPLCRTFPLGTHFLWHLLNAATLSILLLAATRHGAANLRRTFPSST